MRLGEKYEKASHTVPKWAELATELAGEKNSAYILKHKKGENIADTPSELIFSSFKSFP